jgi:hypothetical protein
MPLFGRLFCHHFGILLNIGVSGNRKTNESSTDKPIRENLKPSLLFIEPPIQKL